MGRGRSAVCRVITMVVVALASALSWSGAAGASGAFSSPSSAVAGETITVSTTQPCLDLWGVPFFAQVVLSETGAGNPPLAVVNLALDQGGTWSGPLTLPSSLGAGTYDLEAYCLYLTSVPDIPDEIVIDRGTGPSLPSGTPYLLVPYDPNPLTIIAPPSDPVEPPSGGTPAVSSTIGARATAVVAAPTTTG